MKRRHDEGAGFHTIAKELNALGVPTKRRGDILLLLNGSKEAEGCVRKLTSGKWQAGNVAKVLGYKGHPNKTVDAWLASRQEEQQNAA